MHLNLTPYERDFFAALVDLGVPPTKALAIAGEYGQGVLNRVLPLPWAARFIAAECLEVWH